ncbi:response regulator transcription factor [Bacillus aquiflavi]|uniref:Response regulator transcription factor n=1 Tax=Bacillus aquiflavi TaxID=2672567 RepID=A0A6B3W168_9BACI|nr:response regulator transcription factor [Bacillus aquiflavi]MBA4537365.1 response regulator transcription factor [Bacillus aquiflavi]NEY81621.1 response regulator transcription factor [Bacillus aquiflavi]UAC49189.1 response regulator transcription factor [Bacillus aquiflavi]
MNILLAEDDERLGKILHHLLQKELNNVDWVKNGSDAYDYATYSPYDVLVLDWMMPKISGIDVCNRLRKEGFQGGILILTAKDDLGDIVTGLDSGADDYVVKPFEFEELYARIRALSRRKEKRFEQVLQLNNLSLHLDSHLVMKDGEQIDLTKKEYQLLEVLMRNKEQVLTREQLIETIWGFDADISDNALDALIKLVRKKIDRHDEESFIQTVRGVGYKMRDKNV